MSDEWFPRFRKAIERALEDGTKPSDLGKKAGVNRNMAGDIVKKGTIPSVENFLKICQAIDADPIQILTGAPQPSREVSKALQIFATWPDDQQKSFLDWIEKIQAARDKNTRENQQPQASETLSQNG